MKKNLLLSWLLCFFGIAALGQNQPIWTKSITALPDSAYMFPVRTIADINGNNYVLSTYGSLAGTNNKIVVNKIGSNGSIAWSFTYDHGGTGSPRGFDMAVSDNGQCFICGGFMNPPYKMLLMKISPFGSLDWMIDSASSIQSGSFDQAFIHYNKVYLSGYAGVAVFDFNGNELWSKNTSVSRMAVDNIGQAIVTGFNSNATVWRYDSLGNMNFSDSTIDARHICTDSQNGFALLNDNYYSLVKYNAAGILQWQKDSLVSPNAFGDIGCEVIADPYDNIIAVGLMDTMFKFSPAGNLLWRRSMNGLDNYKISARMNSDLLVVAGTGYDSTQYDVKVSIFNSLGWTNWSGGYNSNTHQEFSVDLSLGTNGFYVLADSISNSDLLYFTLSAGLIPPDFSLYCVDSVWYDTTNSQFINVRIFNGDINHINYPTVMIISPLGDTISNKTNMLNFFAQLANTYQTYNDSIYVQGITDFSGYTFVMTDNLSDSSGIIPFCSTLSIVEPPVTNISIYPNPSMNYVHVYNSGNATANLNMFDMTGRFIRQLKIERGDNLLDVSQLRSGMYMLRCDNGQTLHRLIKMED